LNADKYLSSSLGIHKKILRSLYDQIYGRGVLEVKTYDKMLSSLSRYGTRCLKNGHKKFCEIPTSL